MVINFNMDRHSRAREAVARDLGNAARSRTPVRHRRARQHVVASVEMRVRRPLENASDPKLV